VALEFAERLQPTLVGDILLLRPLRAEDFEALYGAASDPLIWQLHPDPERWRREVFVKNYFQGAVDSHSAFVIIDRRNGAVIGSSRYYDVATNWQELAIGYTFLSRAYWGGSTNSELKHLMLAHAFQFVESVVFHVGKSNLRSRRALEKIGAQFELETERESNGVMQPQCNYRIHKANFLKLHAINHPNHHRAPLKTLGFLRSPLAHGCANRNQSCKALILKKNENDAFRFSCALKTQEGFLEAPISSAVALPRHWRQHFARGASTLTIP
jgi:N-acetyltransferase